MATENNNLDLFSLLPESLLLAIISFLPFKEAAARTCILNKKWFNIWQPGNNIDFDENFFVDSTSDEIKQAQRKVFIDFITNWIAHFTHREIHKFSLKISNPFSCSYIIESYVEFAVQRRVKDLTLDFSDQKNFNNNKNNAVFPVTSQVHQLGSSLETLKLSTCNFIVLDFVNFSALRDLSLSWMKVNIIFLKTVLSNCRASLHSLSLENCWGLKHFDLGNEPIWLTRLVINKCEMNSDDISFVAPRLEYFKYSGLVFYSNMLARAIEEVDIDFALESRFNEFGDELCKILQDFSAAKILTVCSYPLQVIPSGNEPLLYGDFNVRHLILNTQMHPYELGGLEFLLNNYSSLEKLTLNIGSGVIFEDYELPYDVDLNNFWRCRRVVPEWLITSLKVVEVNKSKTTNSIVKTLIFFMLKGEVLEQINMNICRSDDDDVTETRYEHARVLMNAQKCSKNLQVSIYFIDADGV